MTTRFSVAELADMLKVPVEVVRHAADQLAAEFTGESFLFNERSWRIAPSDVKRIQEWIATHEDFESHVSVKQRRVRAKRVSPVDETGE